LKKGGRGDFSSLGVRHLWFMDVYRESPDVGAGLKPASSGNFMVGGANTSAITVYLTQAEVWTTDGSLPGKIENSLE
jgi:hypothetical protein